MSIEMTPRRTDQHIVRAAPGIPRRSLPGMMGRNTGVPHERRIEFRVGIHLGDVVEEADGNLMGDGVNIAARLESVAESKTDRSEPRAISGK
jgi:class 3 adenylate cyclase